MKPTTAGYFEVFIEGGLPVTEFELGDLPCCDFPLQCCIEIGVFEQIPGKFKWAHDRPRPTGRFRFHADVIFVPYYVHAIAGKFKFATEVFEGPPPAEVLSGKFKFKASVTSPVIPEDLYRLCLDSALVQYGVGPNIPELVGATSFTLMFWGRRRVSNALVSCGQESTSLTNFIDLALYTDGNLYAIVGDGSGIYYGSVGGCNDTLEHHLAMVYNGAGAANSDRLKVYIDGVLQTLSFAGTIPSTVTSNGHPFLIGSRPVNALTTNGDLDDVAVFAAPLKAAVIARIAARTNDPSFQNPAMLLRFEEGGGAFAFDSSGNGHSFTLYNDAGFCSDIVVPSTASRFKFHTDVVHVVTPGPAIPGRFRFSGDVRTVAVVGEPIAGKFRFSHENWTPTVATSTQSLRFVEADSQYQWFTDLHGYTTAALTVMFWARMPEEGRGPIVFIDGPSGAMLQIAGNWDSDLGFDVDIKGFVDEDLVHVSFTAPGTSSHGWHHYALVFEIGSEEAPNSYKWYVDGVDMTPEGITPEAVFPLSHTSEEVWIGRSKEDNYSNCLMDNVTIAIGAWSAENISLVANAEIDPLDFYGEMLFRYEDDEDLDFYEDIRAVRWPGATFGILHSDDVPPLLR